MSAPVVARRLSALRTVALVLAAAVGLSVLFWTRLWTGGGLVGGDVYYYFLPQKVAYAEALQAGEWPIWNDRVGLGYPTVGESQTGVFYPPNLILYGLLPTDRAYALSMVLHYVLAFAGTWLLARRTGLTVPSALLAATVYTYGWFPERISLEWTILGGAWLPIALWLAESFLQTGRYRYPFALALVLMIQLLPGHFTLAFITQLLLAGWVGLRTLFRVLRKEGGLKPAGVLAMATVMGFLLAAVQLGPTWELKQLSQRQTVTKDHDPAYGYLPPKYLLQVIAPWHWYGNETLFRSTIAPNGPRTNKVEAHLYFGLLPLALAAWSLFAVSKTSRPDAPPEIERTLPIRDLTIVCLVLGLLAVVYSTGCLIPLTKHLPGFSFFEGPGRYGIVTTLCVAVLGGLGFDAILAKTRPSVTLPAVGLVLLLTVADLWLVAQCEWVAVQVAYPPIANLPRSELRERFHKSSTPLRLLTKASNAATLLGPSAWPPYLGLGPAAYVDPDRKLPDPIPYEGQPAAAQLSWLRRAGVTHLLWLEDVDRGAWRDAKGELVLRFTASTLDPVLNPVLATQGPLRLYELMGSRGRYAYSGGTVNQVQRSPTHVELDVDGPGGTVIVTELMYPGWDVRVDGQPAKALEIEGMLRGVEVTAGRHQVAWSYRPASLRHGLIVSGITLAFWLGLGHLWFWKFRCW